MGQIKILAGCKIAVRIRFEFVFSFFDTDCDVSLSLKGTKHHSLIVQIVLGR